MSAFVRLGNIPLSQSIFQNKLFFSRANTIIIVIDILYKKAYYYYSCGLVDNIPGKTTSLF